MNADERRFAVLQAMRAEPVLRHRMALNFAARADGVRLPEVIDTLKAQLA